MKVFRQLKEPSFEVGEFEWTAEMISNLLRKQSISIIDYDTHYRPTFCSTEETSIHRGTLAGYIIDNVSSFYL